ncbi:flagella basal body P-ring formation protein FlgA, partial [Nitratireductor sp. ZSWI3]|nr:flagella basal body P-ring formation protein FlgA [Nitratireductor sp. ZSWI3]
MKRHPALLAPAFALAVLLLPTPDAGAEERAVVPTRVIYPGETINSDTLNEIVLRRPPRDGAAVARA